MTTSPFHAGERAVQARIGVRERIEQIGQRVLRPFMPDQHRELFEDLPFVVAASSDARGRLWASLLSGAPGFIQSPTARTLLVGAEPWPSDPLRDNLRAGAPLGLLGIELPTRRRNRANGRVLVAADSGFELEVEQSFGNCPKYIQSRAGSFAAARDVRPPELLSASLSLEARQLLQQTDTTFIATSSRHPEQGGAEGLDVSHRGGRPGFIRVTASDQSTLLTMPDFLGNFMFSTLGNLEQDPRAGLLALDFASGAALSITGSARVLWDGAGLDPFAGAERFLEIQVESGLLWHDVARGWTAPELSPHLRDTGAW